jgi:hypothetical protein
MMGVLFVTKLAILNLYRWNVHFVMGLENIARLLTATWNCIPANASIWTEKIAACAVRSVTTVQVTSPN